MISKKLEWLSYGLKLDCTTDAISLNRLFYDAYKSNITALMK